MILNIGLILIIA